MKKTITHKRYKTTQYNSRHFRLDLLNRLKEIAGKSGDTVEGTINRALAIGVPLLAGMIADAPRGSTPELEIKNGGRTRDKRKTAYPAPTSVA